MTIQKGVDVLVGLVDATYAGAYTIVSGQTTGDIRISDEYVDVTHKSSTGLWREGADGAGIRNASFTVGGYLNEDSSLDTVAAAIFGTGDRHASLGFLIPGVGMVAGDFAVNLETSGALNTAAEFTLTAENAGDATFVPGVQDRYAMQASLVLNFVEDSYWVSGVHNTAFASVTGASVTRVSKKWDPDWSFVSGEAVGTLEEFASGVAAVGARGLLVEETSINTLPNPRGSGAAAGTPGTIPTGWAIDAAGSAIMTVVGSGTSNGWPYTEITLSGTPSGDFQIYLMAATDAAALTGEDWTVSAGFEIVSGDTSNLTSLTFLVAEYTAASAFVTQGQSGALSIDTNHRRHAYTRTLDGGGTVANARPTLYFDWAGAGALNITLRIYAPQFEKKAYPTSPILPVTTGATTRAADVITVANGAWSNDSGPGALFADVTLNYPGVAAGYPRLLSYGVDGDNEVGLLVLSNTGAGFSARNTGVTQFALTPVSNSGAGQNVKTIAAFAANDAAVSAYGETQGVDSTVDVAFGTSALGLGCAPDGNAYGANFYLRECMYAPARFSNAKCESKAGN